MSGQAARVQDSCDGKNVDAVLTELGERLHRTVLEHLLQFQYNTTGGSSSQFSSSILLAWPSY